MGCAASENNIIIGKTKDENNDLFKVKSYKNKSSYLSLSNKGESNRINNTSNYENAIYQMKEITSKYNILEQISYNEICMDYKLQLKSDNTKYKIVKIFQKRFLGKENKIYNEIKIINSFTNDKLIKIDEYYQIYLNNIVHYQKIKQNL